MNTDSSLPIRLVGCGILHKEVNHLIRQHGWNLETRFLQAALHNQVTQLGQQLDQALDEEGHQQRQTIVFYGCCHPGMELLLDRHKTVRTQGQNCIAMLLGHEEFMAELEQGSYFLLEEWAVNWRQRLSEVFGSNRAVVREIFQDCHRRVLALRTLCSDDFSREAREVADYLDLPLLWMDAPLHHLEAVLIDVLRRKDRLPQESLP